jgi:hypothetical protein
MLLMSASPTGLGRKSHRKRKHGESGGQSEGPQAKCGLARRTKTTADRNANDHRQSISDHLLGSTISSPKLVSSQIVFTEQGFAWGGLPLLRHSCGFLPQPALWLRVLPSSCARSRVDPDRHRWRAVFTETPTG